MMFRNTREDEESGSDWDDDLTAHTSPARHSPSQPHPPPSTAAAALPPELTPVASLSSPSPTTVAPPPGSPPKTRRATTIGIREPSRDVGFSSLTAVPTPHPPPPHTPPDINPAYVISDNKGSHPHTSHPHTSHPHTPHPPHKENPDRESGVFQFYAVNEASAQVLISDRDTTTATMARLAARSERASQRCAQEVFGAIRLVTDFLIVFTLECLFYCLFHVTRKLLCGCVVVLSDALCKPTLTDCFNALLWPLCSCFWQMFRAFKLCVAPCLDVLAVFLAQCTELFRACRLVEVNWKTTHKEKRATQSV